MAWTQTKEWESIAGLSVLAFARLLSLLSVDWSPLLLLILHIRNMASVTSCGFISSVEEGATPKQESWLHFQFLVRRVLLALLGTGVCSWYKRVWSRKAVTLYKKGCQESCCAGLVDGTGIRVRTGHSQSWANYRSPSLPHADTFFFSFMHLKILHLRWFDCII